MKIGTDANGHPTIDGARWHRPGKDPRTCAVEGCNHQMGTLRRQSWQDEEAPAPKFRRRRRTAREPSETEGSPDDGAETPAPA